MSQADEREQLEQGNSGPGGPFEVTQAAELGTRTFVISSAAIAQCPTRSLAPEHWRSDGTCLHTAEGEPDA